MGKNLEVVFPGQFTQVHPWNKMPDKSELVPHGKVTVSVDTLTHVTHNVEAGEICKEICKEYGEICKKYEFRAKPKFAKAANVGESYRLAGFYESGPTSGYPFYDQIPPGFTVFPGCYSWWGISPKMENNFEISNYPTYAYVPDYLKSTLESRYGNNAFSSKFSDLLAAYARSRCTEVGNTYIRVGGTLRYRCEICYVLIVCTNSPMDVQTLSQFKPLPTESELYKTNGLINESGNVIDHSAILTFHPEYIYSWVNDSTKYYSYETTTFAFYFPEESSMQLDSENCSYNGEVVHEEKFCIKTQPTLFGRKCPNNM